MRVETLPLPSVRHLPGSGSRADHALLERVVNACPPRTEPHAWACNAAWLYGWRLLAAAYYWEAHEVWEPVWQRCAPNSRERLLVQALIQLANALLKARAGRGRARGRLLAHAAGLLDELSRRAGGRSVIMGVDADALLALIQSINAK